MKLWKYINEYSPLAFLALMGFAALFSDFLANEKPIFWLDNNGNYEFFSGTDEGKRYKLVVKPLIRYHDGLDLDNTFLKPFSATDTGHYLGTDHLGRDLLAGIIHGGRISIGISVFSMLIASAIGVMIGGLAGFMGDRRFEISIGSILLILIIAVIISYFVFHLNAGFLSFSIIAVSTALILILLKKRLTGLQKRWVIPMDLILLKFMEIFSSIPTYFLILALVAFVEPSWMLFSFIIGITSWIMVARFTRGEMINVRNLGYLEAAEALGVSRFRIFIRHAIPNALGPLPYAFTFGVAGIIVLESTFSYFGIGLPADTLSWGNFLSGFKNNTSAWWIAVIPGIVIFLTILSLHIVGRQLDNRFNPRR